MKGAAIIKRDRLLSDPTSPPDPIEQLAVDRQLAFITKQLHAELHRGIRMR